LPTTIGRKLNVPIAPLTTNVTIEVIARGSLTSIVGDVFVAMAWEPARQKESTAKAVGIGPYSPDF
jgi:hypothetical protein